MVFKVNVLFPAVFEPNNFPRWNSAVAPDIEKSNDIGKCMREDG